MSQAEECVCVFLFVYVTVCLLQSPKQLFYVSMAQYSMFVLKVALDTIHSTYQTNYLNWVVIIIGN